MFRTTPDHLKSRLFLHKQWSLETCPLEHRQLLAYVLHLRSHWRPDGRAKLIVPTSWREYLAYQVDDKCGTAGVANRGCPLGTVRFESVVKARLITPENELPQDVVSKVLTDPGTGSGCLVTLVPRAFEGIPCTSPKSDLPAMGLVRSTSTLRIDFALVSEEDASAENDGQCLLFGMREPPLGPSATSDTRSGPGPLDTLGSIPEALAGHRQFHATRLLKLVRTGDAIDTTTESFPEWLVLFGLLYDADHVRIIAHVPCPPRLDITDCHASYVVDQVSLRPGSLASGAPACERALERLRLLVALTTLRRHAVHLSKSLLTTRADPCDGIRRTDRVTCDQHAYADSDDAESLERCASLASTYSTCPSSVHVNGVPVVECEAESFSSCRSLASSFCSTCSSLLESATPSSSSYSEGTDSYTEPSTSSHSRGSDASIGPSLNRLTETRRRDINAWAREVIPTEHPVKDTYKMMIVNHQLPGRQRIAEFRSSTRV